MSKCKKCGATVSWKEKPGGGFFPPENPDGSRHDCEGKHTAAAGKMAGGIIARLDSYVSSSATFRTKDSSKTYAITAGIAQEWKAAGYLLPADNHPEVWLEFLLGKNNFIQPGWRPVTKPDWAAALSDPTNGKVTKPAPINTKGPAPVTTEPAPQITPATAPVAPSDTCTSPDVPPVVAAQPTPEELVRQPMKMVMPSDRVGYRISLAGMVNSVIEMEKMSSDAPKTYAELEADVKRKALALFLWCDGLTTQNIKGVQ